MRLVGIDSITPGEKLAAPVCTSSGKVILSQGTEITETYIERLKKLHVFKVYIEDSRFEDIEAEQPIDPSLRNRAFSILSDIHIKVLAGKGEIDEFRIKDIAKDIVDYVREYKARGVSILSLSAVDDHVIEHSLNTAILAAFIGSRMSFNQIQLTDLVAGALIHDLARENSPEESPEHVQKGFDIMRRCRGLSLYSSIVCYEHHENYNGTGYPRKLAGSAISEFSRVIRVADFYDDILHGSRSQGMSLMPHQAYEYLLAESGTILDPAIIETFRDTIVFYPNGCSIQLSNSLKGVVVRQNPGSPHRPVVRVLAGEDVLGEIDLTNRLSLAIKDVVVA